MKWSGFIHWKQGMHCMLCIHWRYAPGVAWCFDFNCKRIQTRFWYKCCIFVSLGWPCFACFLVVSIPYSHSFSLWERRAVTDYQNQSAVVCYDPQNCSGTDNCVVRNAYIISTSFREKSAFPIYSHGTKFQGCCWYYILRNHLRNKHNSAYCMRYILVLIMRMKRRL